MPGIQQQGNLSYIGNPDYRGYLSSLASRGDQNAQYALNLVGNNGGIDQSHLENYIQGPGIDPGQENQRRSDITNYVNNSFGQYQQLANQGHVLGAQTGASTAPGSSLYNAQYDTQRAQLQGQLDTLPSAQNAASLKALNSYQTNVNNLDTQNAQGQRNLQVATNQVNTSKAQSLQQLKDQVGTMYNSYLRQPGVSDSSAGGLIGQALGSSASKNRAGVLQNAGNQLQGIGMQQQDLATSYQQQHAALDSWKNETLSGIAQQFMQQQQSLQQQMAGADAQKAQGLAQQNSALTQQAVAALQNLQNLYKTQSQQLISQYQNPQAPGVDLGGLGQYQVAPISAGQLQGIGAIPQANQSQTPDLAAQLFNKKQDQFNF